MEKTSKPPRAATSTSSQRSKSASKTRRKKKAWTPPPSPEFEGPEEGSWDVSGVWIPKHVPRPMPAVQAPIAETNGGIPPSNEALGREPPVTLVQASGHEAASGEAQVSQDGGEAGNRIHHDSQHPRPRIEGGEESGAIPIERRGESQAPTRRHSHTAIPETQLSDQEGTSRTSSARLPAVAHRPSPAIAYRGDPQPSAGPRDATPGHENEEDNDIPPCGQRPRESPPLFYPSDSEDTDHSDSDCVPESPIARPTTRRSTSHLEPYSLPQPEDAEASSEGEPGPPSDWVDPVLHPPTNIRRPQDFIVSDTESAPSRPSTIEAALRRSERKSKPSHGLRKVKTYLRDSRGVPKQRLERVKPRDPAQGDPALSPEPRFLAEHNQRTREIQAVKQELYDRAKRAGSTSQWPESPASPLIIPDSGGRKALVELPVDANGRAIVRGRTRNGVWPDERNLDLFPTDEPQEQERDDRVMRPVTELTAPRVDSQYEPPAEERRLSARRRKRYRQRYVGTSYTDADRYGLPHLDMVRSDSARQRVDG